MESCQNGDISKSFRGKLSTDNMSVYKFSTGGLLITLLWGQIVRGNIWQCEILFVSLLWCSKVWVGGKYKAGWSLLGPHLLNGYSTKVLQKIDIS